MDTIGRTSLTPFPPGPAHHVAERRPVAGADHRAHPAGIIGVLGLAAVVLVHELAEAIVIANDVRAGRTKALQISTGSVRAVLAPAAVR